LIPTTHLPRSGYPGTHSQPRRMVLVILGTLARQRTRTHQRHIPPEHVPQLRQLVQACLPQERSDTRYARVMLHLEHVRTVVRVLRRQLFFQSLRINSHRTELEYSEHATTTTEPFLSKEHRTRRRKAYRH